MNAEKGEMNDVDDETMFGENDVSFVHTVPSVSLPEIDRKAFIKHVVIQF